MKHLAELPGRGVIRVAGADRVGFLNGLVSNDVSRAMPGGAVWAALLSPQGRYVSDFFIFSDGEALFLDAPRAAVPELAAKLKRFRLRAAVEVENISDALRVYAAWGGMPPRVDITAPDPRLEGAGFRSLSPETLAATATSADYDAHRLGLGLPDGPPDLEVDKTLLLEAGFDELNGVDWEKGCYMGQELTARTKYRGLVKRRLVPVRCDGQAPAPGTVICADGAEVGAMRSGAGAAALATIRLDALGKALTAAGVAVTPAIPGWMRLPA